MFTRILLALDGTESSDVAVSFATALARQLDSSVRVVHVNELLVGGRGFASKTELESMEIVDEAVGRLRNEGIAADGVHYLANCFTIADCTPMYAGLEAYYRNIKKWHKKHKPALIAAWDEKRPTDCPVGKFGKPASLTKKDEKTSPDKK